MSYQGLYHTSVEKHVYLFRFSHREIREDPCDVEFTLGGQI